MKERGALRRLALVALVAGGLYALVYGAFYFERHAFEPAGPKALAGTDFFVFWAAGKLIRAGRAEELYSVPAFEAYQKEIGGADAPLYTMPYPPNAALLFVPLGGLSYGQAYALWLLGGLLIYLWVASRGRHRLLVAALLLAAPSTLVTLVGGQNGFHSACLALGTVLLWRRSPWLAGSLLGLLAFKPQLGVMFPAPAIASRSWRLVLAATATILVWCVLTTWYFGPEIWGQYRETARAVSDLALTSRNSGFARQQASVFRAVLELGGPHALAIAIQLLASGAVTLLVVRVFLRNPESSWAPLLLIASTSLGPWVSFYDLPMVSAIVVWSAIEMAEQGFRRWEQLVLLASWALPFLGMGAYDAGFPIAPLIASALVWILYRRAVLPSETGDPASRSSRSSPP